MKKIPSTSFFYIFKQKFNNEKKKIKILLSVSAMVLMTTNVIAEEELHINVNYGGQKDLYYDITSSTLLKTLDFSKNATQKTTIDLPGITSSWKSWSNNNTALNDLRNQACAKVYTIDGQKALSAFVLANSNNNISLPTNAFSTAQLFDKAKASNLTVNNVPFIPTITIKRGNFDLKEGTLGGVHIKKHTDLNLLMQNTIMDESNSSLTSSGIYQGMDINAVLAKRIIEQFNFKYWTYIAPSSKTGLYAYIPTFRNKLQTILASKKTTPYETKVLTYINDIIDLSEKYVTHYLPITSYTQNANETCGFSGIMNSRINDLNSLLKSSATNQDILLTSFMKTYDISKTIMNFEKFFYRVDYSQSGTNINFIDEWFDYFTYNINNVKLNLNRIYALKIIDKNGKASGTYANLIEFNENSTPQQGTVIFTDGQLTPPPGSLGAAGGGSYQDLVNLFDTTQTDSTSFAVGKNEETLINESYASPKTENIELSCQPYYQLEKFVNNVVYVDANAMKMGNNHFSVKNQTDSDMLKYKKKNIFLTDQVVNQVKTKLTNEHLIGNYIQNLTNTKFVGDPNTISIKPNFANAYDTMYFYQKLIDTNGVGSECLNLFSGSKITKPSVVYLANSLDVFKDHGTAATTIPLVSNVPHLPFNSIQEIQPMNSIMNETTTHTRDTDGNPDAEIEKRLSISANYPINNPYMYTQNNLDGSGKDKINWFPDTTVVSTYFPMWRPVDDLTYNNYGPVGPFFNKKDIVYKEKYEGCDVEQRAIGTTPYKVAPETVDCEIPSCDAETNNKITIPANTCAPGATGCVSTPSYQIDNWECNPGAFTIKDGKYATYEGTSGSCKCNADIPNLNVNKNVFRPALDANRNLSVNRFCTYDMEAMKYKLRKRKYNYEHSSNDEGKIDINGFDSTSLDPEYSTYGNFDEIKGYVDSEITIPNRASYPLTFNDTVHYTNELVDPFDIYWDTTENDDFDPTFAGINGVAPCGWDEDINVQFKNMDVNQTAEIIQPTIVEPILQNLQTNTGGVAAAKVLMYSDKWETTEWTACDGTNLADDSNPYACGDAVVNAIPELKISNTNAAILTTNFMNYLKEGSKLKFGSSIPLRLNDTGEEIKDYIGESNYNVQTWLSEYQWGASGTRVFYDLNLNNPIDFGWIAINYNNLKVSIPYNKPVCVETCPAGTITVGDDCLKHVDYIPQTVQTDFLDQSVSVSCSSRNYAYAECKIPQLETVNSVSIIAKHSKAGCGYGSSFGILSNRTGMWVSSGCRGTFNLNGGSCPVGYNGAVVTETKVCQTVVQKNGATVYTCPIGYMDNGTDCQKKVEKTVTCGGIIETQVDSTELLEPETVTEQEQTYDTLVDTDNPIPDITIFDETITMEDYLVPKEIEPCEPTTSPAILIKKGIKIEQSLNGLYYTPIISSETTYGAQATCSSLGNGWRLPQGNETGTNGIPVGGQEYVIQDYSKYCSGNGQFATLSDCQKYVLSPAETNDWHSPRRDYRCVNTSPINVTNGYLILDGLNVSIAKNGIIYTDVLGSKVPAGARNYCTLLGPEWRLPKGCETGTNRVPVGGQEYVYTDSCACNTWYTLSTKSDCKGYLFGWGDVRKFRCVATESKNVISTCPTKYICPIGYTEYTKDTTQCIKTINYSYPNTAPMDIACTYAARKYLTGNESTKIYTSADDNNGKYIYGLYLIPENVASVVNGVEYDSEGNVVIPPDQCRIILYHEDLGY